MFLFSAQVSSLASSVSCVPESETPQIQILKKMVLSLKQNNGNKIVTSVSRVDIGIQRGAVKLHLQMNHSVPPSPLSLSPAEQKFG